MEDTDTLDELIHYGVLGMKWGVRKDRVTGVKKGSPIKGTPKAKRSASKSKKLSGKTQRIKEFSPEHKSKEATKKKRASTLTNKQLSDFNERVRLEREFAKAKKGTKSKGRKIVEEILTDVGKTQAKYALNRVSRTYVDGILEKALKTKKK